MFSLQHFCLNHQRFVRKISKISETGGGGLHEVTRSISTLPWMGYWSMAGLPLSIKFAGSCTQSYTVRVKCLAQEHNTMSRPLLKPSQHYLEASALAVRPLSLLGLQCSWHLNTKQHSTALNYRYWLIKQHSRRSNSLQESVLNRVFHYVMYSLNIYLVYFWFVVDLV